MLNNALDYGISEQDFWSMTFAELDRLVESRRRMERKRLQEKASLNHNLGALVGRAFAVAMDNKNDYPTLEEAYPSLFNDTEEIKKKKEQKQERINELSALRFKQFAQSYNKKYKEVGKINE